MTHFLHRFSTLCVLLLVLVAGCKRDKPYTCDVDPALLDIEVECALDEDCPCGTHCDLGMCGYECTSNKDCDGKDKCDAFGRCSNKKLDSHALPPPGDVSGALTLTRGGVTLSTAGEVRTVGLRAEGLDSGRVRVRADDDLEVQCGTSGGFVRECFFDSLAVDEEAARLLQVRAAVSLDADVEQTHGSVRIWSEHNGRMMLGVTITNPAYVDQGAARSAAPVTESGLYEGTLRLTGMGLWESGTAETATEPVGGLELDVIVEVQPDGDGYLLRITDSLGAIFDGTIVRVDDQGLAAANTLFLVSTEDQYLSLIHI